METSAYRECGIRKIQCRFVFINSACTNILCKTEQSHSPGALTADQHKVGDDIDSAKTIKSGDEYIHIHSFLIFDNITEGYSLWCPVHSLVSLYETPDRLAVRNREHSYSTQTHTQQTHKQAHKTHARYTHTNVNIATMAVVTSSWDARIKYTWKNTHAEKKREDVTSRSLSSEELQLGKTS